MYNVYIYNALYICIHYTLVINYYLYTPRKRERKQEMHRPFTSGMHTEVITTTEIFMPVCTRSSRIQLSLLLPLFKT